MLATILAALLAAAAPPPAPIQRGPIVARPDWDKFPTAKQMAKAFPDRAARNVQDGRVVLFCDVGRDRRPTACEVVQETPLDYGFGDSALKLAPLFRMKRMTLDGLPVARGSRVRLALSFRSPD